MSYKSKEHVHVLATSKVQSAAVYSQEYGVAAVNVCPEALSGLKEPVSEHPLRQAFWKDHQVATRFRHEPDQRLVIDAADTVALVNGQANHKPGRHGSSRQAVPLDADTHEQYIAEAQGWYKDPFLALWSIAFVHHVCYKSNRATVLRVQTSFPEGIHKDTVRALYDPAINARIPLAEEALARGQSFTISPELGTVQDPLPDALVLQLIRDRVLPKEWLKSLAQAPVEKVVRDEWGTRRKLVSEAFWNMGQRGRE